MKIEILEELTKKGILPKSYLENLKAGNCPVCGKTIDPDTDFRDSVSLREWAISKMCQKCQDSIFK
jgi:hypothetical protein